jgi:hypothetical protein
MSAITNPEPETSKPETSKPISETKAETSKSKPVSKPGSGLPGPATLKSTIRSLFQNERLDAETVTFSRAILTRSQKKQLVYPEGFDPLNFYVIYQTNKKTEGASEYRLSLVSFTQKGKSKYIYGVYFDIVAQDKFKRRYLRLTPDPVSLSETARFVTAQYLELYNEVNGIPVILGLSTDPTKIGASLQYSHHSKYYYEVLGADGITDLTIPKTYLTGLSRNLQ